MNLLDIIILVIVGAFTIRGIAKGFIREIGTIIGICLSIIISTRYVDLISAWLLSHVGISPVAAIALTYFFTFIIVFVTFILLLRFFVRIVHSTPLGLIDTMGGGVLGLLFGALLVSIIFVVLGLFPFSKKWVPGKNTSMFYPYIEQIAPKVYDLFEKITKRDKTFYDEFAMLKQYIVETEEEKEEEDAGNVFEMIKQLKNLDPEKIQEQMKYFEDLESGKGKSTYSEAIKILNIDTTKDKKTTMKGLIKQMK